MEIGDLDLVEDSQEDTSTTGYITGKSDNQGQNNEFFRGLGKIPQRSRGKKES